MNMSNEDFTGMHVNLQRVAQERSMLSITRALALDLIAHPYLSVGDFFKGLSDMDVQTLVDIIEGGDEHPHFEELLLISQMLYTAEGLGTEIGSLQDATVRANALIGFTLVVSLERKGLARVHYEHMSFGDEVKDKVIVSQV
jgi:hypothetical protein